MNDVSKATPLLPLSKIIEGATAILSAPDSKPAEISVTLTGDSARRWYFAQYILEHGYGLAAIDIDKYLVWSGAERQIERLLKTVRELERRHGKEKCRRPIKSKRRIRTLRLKT